MNKQKGSSNIFIWKDKIKLRRSKYPLNPRLLYYELLESQYYEYDVKEMYTIDRFNILLALFGVCVLLEESPLLILIPIMYHPRMKYSLIKPFNIVDCFQFDKASAAIGIGLSTINFYL